MKTHFKGIRALKNEVLDSEEMITLIQNNPKAFFEQLEPDPIRIPWVYAIVVSIVGLGLLTSIILIGSIALSDGGKDAIPEILGVIATSAITGIVGLLAPSPINNAKD
ncbi:MAG: hypothetical protein AAF611_18330 [Bacteroidota bacterium]